MPGRQRSRWRPAETSPTSTPTSSWSRAAGGAGVDATVAVWDDADVDWARFDLVVIRSTWDYIDRRDDFVAWARSVDRLANPADVIAWNTDKRYLRELAAAGCRWWTRRGSSPATPRSPNG